MARFLIVGCGCRGQALGRELIAAGHVVRGTTRDAAKLPAIEAAGAEAALADPYRLATLMPLLDGASAVLWLMGTANDGDLGEAVHTTRLESMLELIVDTHARGFVYETGGVRREVGEHAVSCAREVYDMPIEVLATDPADHARWLTGARDASLRLLAG